MKGGAARHDVHALHARERGVIQADAIEGHRAVTGEAVADADILDEIRPCFIENHGARTDTVVLACTHYPLLLDRLNARGENYRAVAVEPEFDFEAPADENGDGNVDDLQPLAREAALSMSLDGVPVTVAKEALALAAAKLPIKTRFVARIGAEG